MEQELTKLEALLDLIPEEVVSSGDANGGSISVQRLITDKAGELPSYVNQPNSNAIIDLIRSQHRSELLAELFDWPNEGNIRRCQVHRLLSGGSIGRHVDAESNPANQFAVILQLGNNFSGGDFVVYPRENEELRYATSYGEVLITKCNLPHEVTEVTSQERKTLNLFFSLDGGVNRRDAAEKCSRPNCTWCGSHLRSNLS